MLGVVDNRDLRKLSLGRDNWMQFHSLGGFLRDAPLRLCSRLPFCLQFGHAKRFE